MGVNMHKEFLNYTHDTTVCKGFLAAPDTDRQRPVIIVAHAWMGQDNFAREKAEELAQLGYIGFAADLYGNGTTASSESEALSLMTPLFLNRQLLQGRINAAVAAVSKLPYVDTSNIGAIGFCFGGLTVIELLRSGAPVKAVASFHAVLGNQIGDHKAHTVPIAKDIKGHLMILHGHDDPLVTPQDITSMQTELTKAEIDWQMHIYSHTSHAFTNPEAHDTKHGLIYNPLSNQRAWNSMRTFFTEFFGEKR
jgi:dienelactone hydrolase